MNTKPHFTKRTLFHYDDVGQLKSEVEGSGAELNRTYAYDAMGNRQSQTSNEPSTTSAPATQTSFTRNPLNQITASTYSNAATPASFSSHKRPFVRTTRINPKSPSIERG